MSSPNYGFGSSTREVAAGRPRAMTPGPGTYAPSHLEMGSEGPKYTATPKRFQNDRSSTPGPGAYQHAGSMGGGPSYSMKPRRDVKQNNADALGPGTYYTQFGY